MFHVEQPRPMNAAAKFPLDLTELSVFRALKEALGGVAPGVHFFWLLWRDLAQLAQEGGPLGRMTPPAQAGFADLLADLRLFPSKADALAFVHGPCVAAALLVRDGDDLVCLRFTNLNADLVRRVARESLGGKMKAFNAKQSKAEGRIKQLELRVPADAFKDADGSTLDTFTVQRVSRLIIGCDNALLRDRPPVGWTEGLVQLALGVIRKLTDEQIDYTLRKVVAYREHPALMGLSTDKLLPQFATILGKVGEDC